MSEARRFAPQGALTMANAARCLAEGRAAAQEGDLVVDFSQVEEADSAALALLFDWQRVAAASGHDLRVGGLPAGLESLADLYGVADLMPRDEAAVST